MRLRYDDPEHYNLVKTLSYDARVNIIIGPPNKGKTLTTRGYALESYIKKRGRFCEICRTKTLKQDIKGDYFGKLAKFDQFSPYEYKSSGMKFLMRRRGERRWSTCGYIVSLSELQNVKEGTFVDVANIIYDEAIIERIDRTHRYMPDEWNLISRVADSVVREAVGDARRPKIFMLGNAVDLINPHFQALCIRDRPPFGYSWYNGKTVLVHYVEPDEYDRARSTETLAGIMGGVTGYTTRTYANDFGDDRRFIGAKTRAARFTFGVQYKGERWGIWADFTQGLYFVCTKFPKSGDSKVYALTREDGSANAEVARRGNRALQGVVDMYYAGCVLFDTIRTREHFLDAMALFGVR